MFQPGEDTCLHCDGQDNITACAGCNNNNICQECKGDYDDFCPDCDDKRTEEENAAVNGCYPRSVFVVDGGECTKWQATHSAPPYIVNELNKTPGGSCLIKKDTLCGGHKYPKHALCASLLRDQDPFWKKIAVVEEQWRNGNDIVFILF